MKTEKINKPMHEDNPRQDTVNSSNVNNRKILFHWQALEYEDFKRSKKWYAVAIPIFIAVIGWAVYTRSAVMAITFLLAGIIGYVQLKKEPRMMDFMITSEGIVAGKEIYIFDNLSSFWIFYESEGLKAISLHTKSSFIPYVQVPLSEEDPVEIRKILLDRIPEEKHELGIVEILGRIVGM
jgi:hypothetical protein